MLFFFFEIIIIQSSKQTMFTFQNGYNYPCYQEPYPNITYYVEVPCYYNQQPTTWFYDQNALANQSMTANLYSYSYVPNYNILDKDEANSKAQTTRGSENSQQEENEKEQVIDIDQNKEEKESDENCTNFRLEQKYGRNIASNIFHNIIKKAASQSQFDNKINTIITLNKLTITKAQFHDKLTEKTQHLKGYVNSKTIKGLLIGKRIGATRLDLEFSKILRILSKVYIDKCHIPHIYYSNKIKRKSRPLHLKRMRKLLKNIL